MNDPLPSGSAGARADVDEGIDLLPPSPTAPCTEAGGWQAGADSHLPLRWRLFGLLDAELLERALKTAIGRHEHLWVCGSAEVGGGAPLPTPPLTVEVERVDLSHVPLERRDREAEQLFDTAARRPFPVNAKLMIRADLIRMGPEFHELQITVHAAVFARVSMAAVMQEMAAVYQAAVNGQPCSLEPLPPQGGGGAPFDAGWQTPGLPTQQAWWSRRLEGMTRLDLPTDLPRPSARSTRTGSRSTHLPPAWADRLHAVAADLGALPFDLHLAAFTLLLHRYTGSTDIAVGTPVMGKALGTSTPLAGLATHLLVLRNDVAGNPSAARFLAQVCEARLQAFEHQDWPCERLLHEVKPQAAQGLGQPAWLPAGFSHAPVVPSSTSFGGVSIVPASSRATHLMFDLHLSTAPSRDGWRVVCEYSTDLYSDRFIERLLQHFNQLLLAITTQPGTPVDQLDMLAHAERIELLGPMKGEVTDYPRNATIGALFQETAQRHSHRVALRCGNDALTYAQLQAQANRLAGQLIDAGVAPGDLVAISARPSPEMIVGFLAILLAGGCCVPIDPTYPAMRFALLLEDCGAAIGLATPGCEHSYPEAWKGTIVPVPVAGASTEATCLPEIPVTAEHPAHLLFTSGSTGRPKGVLLPHRGVVRLVRQQNFMAITPDDVFLQAAPVSFDASLLEIWGPLLNGGCLVLLPQGPGIAEIASAVRRTGVTNLWLTSGLFELMMNEAPEALRGLRYLLSGGDVLPRAAVRRALELLPDTQLINGYGPTENTTFTCCHTITPADLARPSIPIGKPVANTTVYLLDTLLRLVPIGVPGELFAGGDGLAIAYHGAPEMTAEKFVMHPVFGRLYRTGDRCRRMIDGTLEFLGRADHQVKVRGFRIEPGEIECLLTSHPDVRDARAGVRGDSADTRRVLAWVIPHEGRRLCANELQAFLATRLPAYMQPAAILVIDAFPLNANGKVQVSALPDPAEHRFDRTAVVAVPPVGATEQQLALIWSELFGTVSINRHDHFFELGGNSLMALRMFSRINRQFGRSLPLAALLEHPTIEQLAAVLALPEPHGSAAVAFRPGKGHVVAIATGGGDTPLFCIHGGDGGVLFYRSLAALLPPDMPLYAIESLELGSGAAIEAASIEGTAASYIRSLQAVQPQGPYRLAGYSFGGVVAHEMACQLSREGHLVEFLGLFDTHNPAVPARHYSMAERLRVFWTQNSVVPVWRRLRLVQARLRDGIRTRRRMKAELLEALCSGPAEPYSDLRRVQVRQHHLQAMQTHRPKPYPGRITLFKAATLSDKLERPADYGWSRLAQGGLDVVLVAGGHLTLFAPENIASLARALRDALDPASARKR